MYKSTVEKRLNALDDYYQQLRKALAGTAPDSFLASAYGVSKEEMPEQFSNVDITDVMLKLEHFKAEFVAIKALKGVIVKPNRS